MLTRRNKKFWRLLSLRASIISGTVLLITALIFSTVFVLKNTAQSNSVPTNIIATTLNHQVASFNLPIRLIIPIINVDAVIKYNGLTSDGAMDIDKDPTTVAWYRLGPRPGETGSAVIAGHYGWTGNEPAAFNDIHTLIKGDELSIIDEKGTSISFIVQIVKKYSPEAEASSVFKSTDGKSHLNLITCGGTWENSKNTYSDRIVVFADKKT